MEALDERQELILSSVIHEYLLSAQAVSSKRLVDKYTLRVSTATVRNDLAYLEEIGLLAQPHKSAGRLPTEKGYRYYVDSLLRRNRFNFKQEQAIGSFYEALNQEMEDLLAATTDLLSELTSYVSVVFAPRISNSYIKHLDLVLLGPQDALCVLITSLGRVTKTVIKLKNANDKKVLKRVESLLNSHLGGASVDEARRRRRKILEAAPAQEKALVADILTGIEDCLSEKEKERIFLSGAINLTRLPEFRAESEKLSSLFEVIENGYVFIGLLEDALEAGRVIVKIGSENKDFPLKDLSLVASNYGTAGEIMGTLGILGPLRMNYAGAIAAVECSARNLGRVLESWS